MRNAGWLTSHRKTGLRDKQLYYFSTESSSTQPYWRFWPVSCKPFSWRCENSSVADGFQLDIARAFYMFGNRSHGARWLAPRPDEYTPVIVWPFGTHSTIKIPSGIPEQHGTLYDFFCAELKMHKNEQYIYITHLISNHYTLNTKLLIFTRN